MKTQYFTRASIARGAAALLILPFQMSPVAEGATQPQDIEVADIARLCVRVNKIGATGIGKEIGTEGETRYEIDGSELKVYLAPVDRLGEMTVVVDGTYGEIKLHEVVFVDVKNDAESEVEISPYIFSAIAAGGGGGDYKTDVYMDGGGRVMVERLEDGSTLILDEHENPIIKRNADGTTEVYDASQSVRQGVTPHGNMWLNMPSDGQFAVNGAMVQGASGNVASGANSHAEGYGCQATGAASHAEGTATIASGQASHAEGSSSGTSTLTASGENSHAEGLGTVSEGKNSHTEGENTRTFALASHAEGSACIVERGANYSHAEGLECRADASYVHVEGSHTYTNQTCAHVQGVYNKPEGGAYAFMHGCGTSTQDRRNAFLIAGDEVYVYGVGGYDGTNYGQEGVLSLRQVLTAIQVKLVNF